MWELPRTTRALDEEAATALRRLGDELGIAWQMRGLFATLKHGVTRFQIELQCFGVEVERAELNENLRWFSLAEAFELALPSTMKTLLTRVGRGEVAATQLALWDE